MPQQNKLRFWTVLFGTMVLFGLSGCMASESQDGEIYIFKKSILYTLFLLGIAITLLVFGIGIIRETLKGPAKKKGTRSSKSHKRSQAPVSPQKKTGGIVLGAGLTLGGLLVLLLGVPGSRLQHITVAPDKVSMRLSVLWFTRGTQEIPFSSMSGIRKYEKQEKSRRATRTDEFMVLELNGGSETIEMGFLEKAAYPKIEEMLAAYQSRGENAVAIQEPTLQSSEDVTSSDPDTIFKILTQQQERRFAQKKPDPNPTLPDATDSNRAAFGQSPPIARQEASAPIDESTLTPVAHIGRLFKGAEVTFGGLGTPGASKGYIVEVYAEGKAKVLASEGKPGEEVLVDLSNVRPGGSMYVPREFGPGTPIDRANPPAPGTKLLAFHAGRWFEAELDSMQGTRPVIRWQGERGLLIAASNAVRIPPPEGIEPHDGKRYNPPTDAGLTPSNERGSYAKGNTVFFREGGTSRKVVIVQMYLQQVGKVRDAETSEEFYAFRTELRTSP